MLCAKTVNKRCKYGGKSTDIIVLPNRQQFLSKPDIGKKRKNTIASRPRFFCDFVVSQPAAGTILVLGNEDFSAVLAARLGSAQMLQIIGTDIRLKFRSNTMAAQRQPCLACVSTEDTSPRAQKLAVIFT